MGNAVSENP